MNNLLSVKLFIAGAWVDVSSGVDINSIKIQDRADWAFVRGGFKLISNTLDKNIAPYTLCRIATLDNNVEKNIEYFCATSQMTINFTKGLYIHDCTLLSAESLLELYILGSKTYTNESNYQVIEKTISILNHKYGINFIDFLDNGLLNGSSDYTFGTGTTLYEVCKQVAEKINIKFKVMFNNNLDIIIYFYNFNQINDLEIDSTSNFLLNCIDTQNSDNYCKYLETESSNVVDRDDVVVWKDLSCRSTNTRLEDRTAQILLPTAVEGITKFEVRGSFGLIPKIELSTGLMIVIMNHFGVLPTAGVFNLTKTYQELIAANISYGNIANVFQYFYDNGLKDCGSSVLLSTSCDLVYNTILNVANFTFNNSTNFGNNDYTQDYTDFLLEEQEFNTKLESDKSHFAKYKSGDNYIDNLNATYRDDFWGWVTRTTEYDFLSQHHTKIIEIDQSNYAELEVYASSYVAQNYLYNVYAVTITNPTIIDTKNSVEENEAAYKPSARSYQMGDSNGMPVYFDALLSDMDRQNETLGRIEKQVDIDTTNFVIPDAQQVYPSGTKFMPFANQKVVYFGTTFYVASLEHKFTATKRYTQLNLTKTPYKIADAIGVDYQFNSIKIPLQNVINRGLFLELTNTPLYNVINQNLGSVYIRYTNTNCDLVKRVSISKDRQDNYYLYFETLDNYSFDKALNGDVITDVNYGDSEAKTSTISLKAYIVTTLTMNESKGLPYYSALPNNLSNYDIATNWNIYKDTREKLTFTIKVKKPE